MKFARISRLEMGSYVQSLDTLKQALDGEFDGVDQWAEVGDSLTIEIIEMSQEKYDNLPEFTGW